jgi:hypothetical protein
MELLRLSQALAPQYGVEEHANDIRSCLARADAAVFVLERPDGRLAGYVEAGTRLYAAGCNSSPVGSLRAHERSGYQGVERIVQFRKALVPESRSDRAT